MTNNALGEAWTAFCSQLADADDKAKARPVQARRLHTKADFIPTQ